MSSLQHGWESRPQLNHQSWENSQIHMVMICWLIKDEVQTWEFSIHFDYRTGSRSLKEELIQENMVGVWFQKCREKLAENNNNSSSFLDRSFQKGCAYKVRLRRLKSPVRQLETEAHPNGKPLVRQLHSEGHRENSRVYKT